MDEFKRKINEELDNIDKKFFIELRRNDSLIHFLKNFIVNNICKEFNYDVDYKKANENFCKKNRLINNADLKNSLANKGMMIEDHIRNLVNSEKLFQIAQIHFSKKAETNFVENKNILNLYTYDLINTNDSDFAYEMYFQIESSEINFSQLKNKSLEEKSNFLFSSVKNKNLIKQNSVFIEKILGLEKNEFTQPFKLNNQWSIIFLKDKKEVKFDQITKSKMVLALFDEWINLLSIELVKKFLD